MRHRLSGANHHICPICILEFPSAAALIDHGGLTHNICIRCNSKHFSEFEEFLLHKEKNPRHAECRHCDESLDGAAKVSRHLEKVHHYCKECDRTFPSQNALAQHKRDSSKHNQYPTCDENHPTPEELALHRRWKHNYCSRCNCDGPHPDGGISCHEALSHHKCAICDVFFASGSNLRNVTLLQIILAGPPKHDVSQSTCDYFCQIACESPRPEERGMLCLELRQEVRLRLCHGAAPRDRVLPVPEAALQGVDLPCQKDLGQLFGALFTQRQGPRT